MIIKVCGIKTVENIGFLSKAEIDMVGLNFYPPSVRYIADKTDPELFDELPDTIKRVGVFVNESKYNIKEKAKKYRLNYAQLHGDEEADFCKAISELIPVIKVFRIDRDFDFTTLSNFESAEYFLFDTHTKNYGGSGKKFNWDSLNLYKGNIPFLLSGGIGPDDVDEIKNFKNPAFMGVDINSKFESQPGIKDKNLVLPFIKSLKVN